MSNLDTLKVKDAKVDNFDDDILCDYDFNRIYKPVNISTLKSVKIITESGKVFVISPNKIAKQCQYFMDDLKTDPATKVLAPYFSKQIIWTFGAETAFTDGNRIAMSPLFAFMLINQGTAEYKKKMDQIINSNLEWNELVKKEHQIIGKYVQYVLIHEIYHQVYQHMRRARLKFGKGTVLENRVANIAMDMEINRDIEKQFDQKFEGSTKKIGGVWYLDDKFKNKNTGDYFRHEAWEEIWDYLMAHQDQFSIPEDRKFDTKDPEVNKKKVPELYEKGWNKAIDAITSRDFDPLNI